MSEIIRATSVTEAWLKGLAHLKCQDKGQDWRDYNLILDISKPMSLSPQEKMVSDALNQFLANDAKKPVSTVINTIFPAGLYATGLDATSLFQKYREITPELRAHPDNRKWGTYFMRMASRVNHKGQEVRPLERLIDRLRKQQNTRSPKRAWYELSMTDPFLDVAIYDNLSDAQFMMGGPCLSHLSFKLKGDRSLILTALYRSHYYIERTLGNLYGLALLQDFVAREAGLEPAELVCHSTMAQIDYTAFGKARVEAFITRCQKLIRMSEPGAPVLSEAI